MQHHGTQAGPHDHVFGQDEKQAGENRTLLIVLVTAVMMVVEIAAGIVYGSMALLADGLHMGSHAVALGISVFAYRLSRQLAADRRFSFGVGKINSLAGFASAVLLLVFASLMVFESIGRYLDPVEIAFDQALLVAVLGLLVNGGSAVVLASTPHHHHGHDDGDHHHHGHGHGHDHKHEHEHDHNLKAAYFHVLADAVTSLLAIAALLAGRQYGLYWLDPAMGIVGGALVARWSYGLLRETGAVLLDHQAPAALRVAIANLVETEDARITDLHLWRIGHGLLAMEMTLESTTPQSPDHYRSLIPGDVGVVHATIEVRSTSS